MEIGSVHREIHQQPEWEHSLNSIFRVLSLKIRIIID
jgi:hypothetical protein